ncbi:hypothetical protein BH24ACI4_BH24ACI4_29120 [soil metagenome]|nr:helix-hairpin-helix domain-containing protein [Acidobacteriota bacterium]
MSRSLIVPLALVALLLGGSVTAAAQTAPAAAATAAPAKTASAGAVVNLNTATPTQLATLPGIGIKTAERIVEHREKSGGFKKVEELMNVKGIGEKSFLKLKELVTVGDPKAAAKQ